MLKDKVVVITGAAGGIGRKLAALLAGRGARLVLTDIRKDKLEELEKAIEAKGFGVRIVEHDVTRPESWDALVSRVLQAFGRIDVLINNAGVVQPGAAWKISQEKVEQQLKVNLLGTIYGCRAVLRVMKMQNFGKIVNIASLAGIVPMPGEAVYCATKFGIRGYSLSLAAELQGTPVGISVVLPDSVDTPQLAYELMHNEAVMSFIGVPLKPEQAARGILKAVTKNKREVLIPGGMGSLCRTAMAFPNLFFLLFPLVKKIGSRNITLRREKSKEGTEASATGAGAGR
jgi:3-oxoacyl-[acyl-carrier protein] reductase